MKQVWVIMDCGRNVIGATEPNQKSVIKWLRNTGRLAANTYYRGETIEMNFGFDYENYIATFPRQLFLDFLKEIGYYIEVCFL